MNNLPLGLTARENKKHYGFTALGTRYHFSYSSVAEAAVFWVYVSLFAAALHNNIMT